MMRDLSKGGLEGEAFQEHSFVARFCQQSWQKRATRKKQCGATGPGTLGWQ
jgi:hypothetical protein